MNTNRQTLDPRSVNPQSLEALERMLQNAKRHLRMIINDQELDEQWKDLQIRLLLQLINKQEEKISNLRRLQT